jgi:hypothetical protein
VPVLTTLARLEKNAEIKPFSGRAHGFYWGSGAGDRDMSVADLQAVVNDADQFFKLHIKSQPSLID